ncbi:hypothetical protein [Methylobacterium indicum]|uniref:Uncharacterized protein n=1 Tax=Methylobacterium indicum TaxID=1775910 RepID=A0A8H9CAF8_9HYPH|nr:hypothetical protein [Methylobacterium indicum]BCM87766.1 hypothetical protein mvi_62270 [Methylobacterium indicum]
MSEQPDHMPEVRRRLRGIQFKYGPTLTPTDTVEIGNRFNEAVALDPSGRQALHYLDDLEERLAPMKS